MAQQKSIEEVQKELLGEIITTPTCTILSHNVKDIEVKTTIFIPDNKITSDFKNKLTFVLYRNDTIGVCTYHKSKKEGILPSEMRKPSDEEFHALLTTLGYLRATIENTIAQAHKAVKQTKI